MAMVKFARHRLGRFPRAAVVYTVVLPFITNLVVIWLTTEEQPHASNNSIHADVDN